MAKITLITGGQRSGKSSYAQNMAEKLSKSPVYLATSRIWDKEFEARVKRHQDDRGDEWTTIEEEKLLGSVDLQGKTVLLDCITLWLTNIFFDSGNDVEASLAFAKTEWQQLMKKDCELLVVTNEIGMGGHAMNEVGRKFTDLQGWVNQYIAKNADAVFFMVSGLPLRVK